MEFAATCKFHLVAFTAKFNYLQIQRRRLSQHS